jgi:leucyl aminopeptidase
MLTPIHAESPRFWITTGADTVGTLQKGFGLIGIDKSIKSGDAVLLEVDEAQIPRISATIHEKFNRCGGFFFHETKEKAEKFLAQSALTKKFENIASADYSINQHSIVSRLVEKVSEEKIRQTITKLSVYNNRYYESETGVQAAKWIRDSWAELAKNRSDVTVELFNHAQWKQPSVIMTIKGSKTPSEVVILGGHLDSIAGMWGGANARAPGADDNASGIATITEVIRLLMDSNYVPERTIKFMGYAAEEVGLRGSREIAEKHKWDAVNVIGVMQLDMTNFRGSDKDIVLMTDFTNAPQNTFVGNLITEYVKVPWTTDKCGYGCSDHASWNSQGYSASMPFESKMSEHNENIHTNRDTLDKSAGNADHAVKFAKLGLGFVVELDR